MYARVTRFKVDPARLPEVAEKIKVMGAVTKSLPGMVSAHCAWREDGQGVLVAVYKSKAAADAAVGKIAAVWGDLVGFLVAAPQTDTFDNVEHLTG